MARKHQGNPCIVVDIGRSLRIVVVMICPGPFFCLSCLGFCLSLPQPSDANKAKIWGGTLRYPVMKI